MNSGKNGTNQAMCHSQPRHFFVMRCMITSQCAFDSSDREASLRHLEHVIITARKCFETPRSERSRKKLHILPTFLLLFMLSEAKIWVKRPVCYDSSHFVVSQNIF